MAPPNRNDITDTGISVALSNIISRFEGLERAISELQKAVTMLLRVESAQADNSKAVDRAFAKIAELEEKVRVHEIEMQRHDAVIQAAKFGAGVLGVGGIGALLTWASKMGGA